MKNRAVKRFNGLKYSILVACVFCSASAWIFPQSCSYDSYHPGLLAHTSNLYHCERFANQVSRDYGYLPAASYVWRYMQGDSPLTPEVVHTTLQDSALGANSLVLAGSEFEEMLLAYEAGRTSRESFSDDAKAKLSEIRKLAKKIRQDRYLSFMDGRKSQIKVGDVRIKSMAEVHGLVDRMQSMAQQIYEGINRFYNQDMTRSISVDELAKPSFSSLSKGIEDLSRTIEKSITGKTGLLATSTATTD